MEQPRETAEQGVARLYEAYQQPIRRYLERLVGSPELAEDLAQETFLKALRHWNQLLAPEGAAAWLFRIARHAAYDEYRRRRRSPGVPLTDIHLETVPDRRAEHALEDREPIAAALARLSEAQQRALLLHSYAGYPVEAITEVLGWKVGTVKSRLARAREQFRRHYVA